MPLISLLLTLKKLYSNSNALIIDFEHAHFSYVILLKVNKKAINLCSKHVQSQLYTQLTFTYSKSTIETLGKVVVVLVLLLFNWADTKQSHGHGSGVFVFIFRKTIRFSSVSVLLNLNIFCVMVKVFRNDDLTDFF